MNIGLQILIVVAVILINAVFVLSEMSVASSRKARLQQRFNEGNKGANVALRLLENPNLFLATVQIGITMVSVLVGAVGGATLSKPLSAVFMQIPALAPFAESLALGIVVVAITFVSIRSEEHTSELQSQSNLVCRLLLEKKKKTSQI